MALETSPLKAYWWTH